MSQSCPLCQSTSVFSSDYPNGKGIFAVKIRSCQNCGVSFTEEQPDDSQLENFYKNEYSDFIERKHPLPPAQYFSDEKNLHRAERSMEQLVLAEKLLKHEPTTILDFGAGHGGTLYFAKKKWPRARLIAIEADPNMQPYLRFVGAEIFSRPNDLPDAFTDLIISSHSLEHLRMERLPMVLIELKTLLRPSGVLVAEVPNAALVECPEMRASAHEPHTIFFSVRSLRASLEAARLSVKNCQQAGQPVGAKAADKLARKAQKFAPRIARLIPGVTRNVIRAAAIRP